MVVNISWKHMEKELSDSAQFCFSVYSSLLDFQSTTFSEALEVKQTSDIVQMSSRAQFSTRFKNLV